MEHGFVAGIHPADSGERLPGAGGDQLLARVATAGPCPITLVEDTSADREWAPLHSHPWDEVYATGPTIERLVEVAGRHGVRPAFDLPDA
jgi:hypothetical protein